MDGERYHTSGCGAKHEAYFGMSSELQRLHLTSKVNGLACWITWAAAELTMICCSSEKGSSASCTTNLGTLRNSSSYIGPVKRGNYGQLVGCNGELARSALQVSWCKHPPPPLGGAIGVSDPVSTLCVGMKGPLVVFCSLAANSAPSPSTTTACT